MNGFRRHLVETAAGQLHLRTAAGEPDRPGLLFLHQVPSSSRIWLPVMEELSEYPSAAPDNLNLGESDRTSRPLSLAEHAEYLWQATQAVAPGPKVLVGHHTGAALATMIAAQQPEAVRGAFLIGYPYYPDWRTKLAKYQRLNPFPVDDAVDGLRDIWGFIDRAFEPDSDRELVFDAFADRIRAGRVWYEGYVALWNEDLTALATRFAELDIPSVLMAPESDILSMDAAAAADLLGSQLLHTPGGAFVLTEHPRLVADKIRSFVDGVTEG